MEKIKKPKPGERSRQGEQMKQSTYRLFTRKDNIYTFTAETQAGSFSEAKRIFKRNHTGECMIKDTHTGEIKQITIK